MRVGPRIPCTLENSISMRMGWWRWVMDFPSVNRHERRTMKILLALLASVLLAGCAVVPMAPAPPAYYRYGPTYYYYPGRYYYYPGPYYGYPYYPFYGRPAPVPPPPPPPVRGTPSRSGTPTPCSGRTTCSGGHSSADLFRSQQIRHQA